MGHRNGSESGQSPGAIVFPDKEIHLLAPDLCMCATMYRIAPQNLAWAMDNLLDGNVVNEIIVDEETKHYAHVALRRMINLTEK